MKKIIVLMIASMIMISGCVVAVSDDFLYARLGDQKLDMLSLSRDPNGMEVTLEGQQSEAQALLSLIQSIQKLTPVP